MERILVRKKETFEFAAQYIVLTLLINWLQVQHYVKV